MIQMNNMKKILLPLITIGLLFSTFVYASTGIDVVFENGDGNPLFQETDVKPGDNMSRYAQVTNNSGAVSSISAKAENFPLPTPIDDLSRALDMVIRDGGVIIWGQEGKTLFDFYQEGEVALGDINPGQTKTFHFDISMSSDKGDTPNSSTTWQAKTTSFDIVVGFIGDDGGNDDGGGDSGGGGGDGNCLIRIIETPITSVTVNGLTQTTANIIWKTNCLGTSQVFYSEDGDSHLLDLTDPEFGYSNASQKKTGYVSNHSIDLSGLESCTKYYFRVVSTNPAVAVSREYNFTTPCVAGTSTDPYDARMYGGESFPGRDKEYIYPGDELPEGEVLGAADEKEIEESPFVRIKQEFETQMSSCGTYQDLPWIIIILTLCLYLIELYKKRHFRLELKKINYIQTDNDKKTRWKIFFKALIYPIIIIIILLLFQWICYRIPWYFWAIILTLLYFRGRARYFREHLQKIFENIKKQGTIL